MKSIRDDRSESRLLETGRISCLFGIDDALLGGGLAAIGSLGSAGIGAAFGGGGFEALPSGLPDVAGERVGPDYRYIREQGYGLNDLSTSARDFLNWWYGPVLGTADKGTLLENLIGQNFFRLPKEAEDILSDTSAKGYFDRMLAENRKLIEEERRRNYEGIEKRLAGRFGPGYSSSTPFLEGEEQFVNRPYFNALSNISIADAARRYEDYARRQAMNLGLRETMMNTRLGLATGTMNMARDLALGIPPLQQQLMNPNTFFRPPQYAQTPPSPMSQAFSGVGQGLGSLGGSLLQYGMLKNLIPSSPGTATSYP